MLKMIAGSRRKKILILAIISIALPVFIAKALLALIGLLVLAAITTFIYTRSKKASKILKNYNKPVELIYPSADIPESTPEPTTQELPIITDATPVNKPVELIYPSADIPESTPGPTAQELPRITDATPVNKPAELIYPSADIPESTPGPTAQELPIIADATTVNKPVELIYPSVEIPESTPEPTAQELPIIADVTPVNKPAELIYPSADIPESTPGPTAQELPIIADATTVSVAPAETSGFHIPPPPKGYGPAAWIAVNQSIEVGGISIPGGLVYVGNSLPTPYGENDPCLIDPSMSIAPDGNHVEERIDYWPSYANISSVARRTYLNWLANGREDPEADIGFVFLFFYGLERRVIIDGAKDEQAQADIPEIAAELRRLLTIYADNSSSFRRHANLLLDWLLLASAPKRLYEKPIPALISSSELPVYLRLALGQAALDQFPVPTNLALTWARLDQSISLRTPAKRCAEEFEKLFAIKYAEIYEHGMVLPRNLTKLELTYQPASAGLHGYEGLNLTSTDIPDISVLTAPRKKLQEVVEAATKPLETFSRLLAKNPSAKDTLEGLLQLPLQLWPIQALRPLQTLQERIGEGMLTIKAQDLLTTLGTTTTSTNNKIISLARTLLAMNIGLVPDVLNGVKIASPADLVVLFTLPPSEQPTSTDGPYLAALLSLQLASAVAAADGDISEKETEHLQLTILSWNHLATGQTNRLLAHLHLLKQAPTLPMALKKKLKQLDLDTKQSIAAFMTNVAHSDGQVSHSEVEMLEKIYKYLELDPGQVFSDVHTVTAGGIKSTAISDQAIPESKDEKSVFKLDRSRIAELQAETEKVSALLSTIFTEIDDPATSPLSQLVVAEATAEAETSDPQELLGLDQAHAALLRAMLTHPEWSRDELLAMAASFELMLDGALEQINEAAFDNFDEPMLEGDDPVTVNSDLLGKLAP